MRGHWRRAARLPRARQRSPISFFPRFNFTSTLLQLYGKLPSMRFFSGPLSRGKVTLGARFRPCSLPSLAWARPRRNGQLGTEASLGGPCTSQGARWSNADASLRIRTRPRALHRSRAFRGARLYLEPAAEATRRRWQPRRPNQGTTKNGGQQRCGASASRTMRSNVRGDQTGGAGSSKGAGEVAAEPCRRPRRIALSPAHSATRLRSEIRRPT
jgi:hypothetical protein